ncbi:MAG: YARHG domain-containing protein [Bacteroidota bacterium]
MKTHTIILFTLILLAGNLSLGQMSVLDIELAVEKFHANPKAENRLMTVGDLWLMRNYVFAKHGYLFSNPQLAKFYEKGYGFKGETKDVNQRLSDADKALIQLFLQKEKDLKKAWRQLEVAGDTFFLEKGRLILPADVNSSSLSHPDARYLSGQKLSEEIYLIYLESDYYIGDVACCGARGARNRVLKQFLYDGSTKHLREVPDAITRGQFVRRLVDDAYLFVFNEILSGPHRLKIYRLSDFQLIGEIKELYQIEAKQTAQGLLIQNLEEHLGYPYRNSRIFYFKEGKLIRTGKVEKIDASMFYAG